jgi:hypothetical protein
MALDARLQKLKVNLLRCFTKQKLLQNSFMIISKLKSRSFKGFEVDPETGKFLRRNG